MNVGSRYASSGLSDERDRRRKKREETKIARSSRANILVMEELSRRGFEAQFSDRKEHVLLVRAGNSAPKPVQVKTVHSTPWYVRRASFDGRLVNQVRCMFFWDSNRGVKPARFFVARNRDLAARFRRPPTSNPIGFIDAKSVEKYER